MKIELRDIKKYYDKKLILKNINLEIESGIFFVILGPSGCGKTSILRLISGLEKPDSGNIFFNKVNVDNLPVQNRNLGYVFQNFALYPNKTVEEIISYPLVIKGLAKSKIKLKTNEIGKILKIENILKRFPEKLSGGEAQRVAIGRALIKDPEIFLFDEPLSNIDANQRAEIRKLILDIHKSTKKTTIYVTHDQEEAKYLGDIICLIKDGEIQQIDKFENLKNKPKNSFVSEFISFK